MFYITIIAVDKIKNEGLAICAENYQKMLSPYAKISIIEIKSEPFGKNNNPKKIKKTEAEKIIKQIPADDFIITLEEKGENSDSVHFADFLKEKTENGAHLTFIIGGSLGLDESVKEASNTSMSLSKLTFTRELARIVLMEQLYRAIAILKQKKYHH